MESMGRKKPRPLSTLGYTTPAEFEEQDKIKKAVRRQRGGHSKEA
jgi:hypothetical protein